MHQYFLLRKCQTSLCSLKTVSGNHIFSEKITYIKFSVKTMIGINIFLVQTMTDISICSTDNDRLTSTFNVDAMSGFRQSSCVNDMDQYQWRKSVCSVKMMAKICIFC